VDGALSYLGQPAEQVLCLAEADGEGQFEVGISGVLPPCVVAAEVGEPAGFAMTQRS